MRFFEAECQLKIGIAKTIRRESWPIGKVVRFINRNMVTQEFNSNRSIYIPSGEDKIARDWEINKYAFL
jgi:hypothetical protein